MKFKEFKMLQLFADDPGAGGAPGTGGGTDPGAGGNNPDDDDADDGGADDDDNPDDDEKKYSIKEVDELIKSINISDNLLEFMVSKDAEKTKKAVDSFAELFNAAVSEAVKGKARQTTPREGSSFSGGKSSLDIGKMARDVRIIK